MLEYTERDWPIVRFDMSGIRTPEDNIEYMDRIEALLDRGERFVLVTADTSTENRTKKGQARRGMQWAIARRGQFKRFCAGFATITTPDQRDRMARAAKGMQKMIPVPIAVFCDEEDAVTWAKGRLDESEG